MKKNIINRLILQEVNEALRILEKKRILFQEAAPKKEAPTPEETPTEPSVDAIPTDLNNPPTDPNAPPTPGEGENEDPNGAMPDMNSVGGIPDMGGSMGGGMPDMGADPNADPNSQDPNQPGAEKEEESPEDKEEDEKEKDPVAYLFDKIKDLTKETKEIPQLVKAIKSGITDNFDAFDYDNISAFLLKVEREGNSLMKRSLQRPELKLFFGI